MQVSVQVRMGIADFSAALSALAEAMTDHWAQRDFAERYRVERIKLGFDDGQVEGECDEAA